MQYETKENLTHVFEYHDLGWNVKSVYAMSDRQHRPFNHFMRYMDDKHSWVIPLSAIPSYKYGLLPSAGVTGTALLSRDPVEASSWVNAAGDVGFAHPLKNDIRVTVIGGNRLRYCYVMAEPVQREVEWCDESEWPDVKDEEDEGGSGSEDTVEPDSGEDS
jgi:hypothetical protein